jgi:hypothetical protein
MGQCAVSHAYEALVIFGNLMMRSGDHCTRSGQPGIPMHPADEIVICSLFVAVVNLGEVRCVIEADDVRCDLFNQSSAWRKWEKEHGHLIQFGVLAILPALHTQAKNEPCPSELSTGKSILCAATAPA